MPFPKNPALEQAVIADAENDLPRLVYADWLDEHGDPARAEFIRVQCALWDKNPADPDYPDLIEQRREVFDRLHGRNDLEPKFPEEVRFDGTLYDADDDDFSRGFHRGFPYLAGEPLDIDGDEEGAADRLRAVLPELIDFTTLRGLNLSEQLSRQTHRVLPADECGSFTGLVTDNPAYSPGDGALVKSLVRSPITRSLRWLALNLSGDVDVLPLAAAKLPNLHRWEAHHGLHGTAAGLKKLTSGDWFGNLHRLLCPFSKAQGKVLWSALAAAPDLHTVQVWGWSTAGGLAPLGTAKPFRSLGRLHLHSTRVTGPDLNGLVRGRFPKLAVFEMNGAMRNDDLKTLVTADWFAGLRVLKLESDDLGDQGVVALGQSSAAVNLRSLSVHTSKLRPRGFAALARDFPNLTTLEVVAVHTVKMTPIEMAAFAATLGTPNLRHLTVNGWPLDDKGAIALSKNPALSNLTRLDLSYTEIGAKGVRALLTSPHLQRLVYLNLSGSPGGAGMDALSDPGVLPHLAHCWLPDRVTKAVFAKLTNDRGNIFVGGPG